MMLKTLFKLPMLATAVVVGCALVVACKQHSNPLLAKPKKEAATFIAKAQMHASNQTHLYDSSESVYVRCVSDPSHYNTPMTKTNPCAGFFQAMVAYAKSTAQFSNVTAADLNNKAVVKRLKHTIFKIEIQGVK